MIAHLVGPIFAICDRTVNSPGVGEINLLRERGERFGVSYQILQEMRGQEHFLAIITHRNHDEQPIDTGDFDFLKDD